MTTMPFQVCGGERPKCRLGSRDMADMRSFADGQQSPGGLPRVDGLVFAINAIAWTVGGPQFGVRPESRWPEVESAPKMVVLRFAERVV